MDIRSNAARLIGRALEDPTVLDSLRVIELMPVDLHGSELQAAYVLLCHLDGLGRLTHPRGESVDARIDAAAANLREVSDWTVDQARERQRVRRACFDHGRPLRHHEAVPTSDELLLEAAARLNIVWWFNLWEQAWPPAPAVPRDVEALTRERTFRRLTELGIRLCQRGNARTAEPAEIADDILEGLDRIDPSAIGRYLTRRSRRSGHQQAERTAPEVMPARAVAR